MHFVGNDVSAMSKPELFQRTPWIAAEVRRIAYLRFGTEYWPAIEAALLNCLESHSVVVKTPNKEKSLAAFVLVCPPLVANRSAYGIDSKVPTQSLEIAFVATDDGWEGHGFARSLLEEVLFRAPTAWLHVDTVNQKAHAFYKRLGFHDFLHLPDPYGSPGIVMIYLQKSAIPNGYHQPLQWSALLNTSPCQTEQPLCRGILPPPGMTCY
jgi:ribosomal protein S18 acetylase RimI-like enzyme